uniref:Ig-like domain-containing protein n=1 Tax=Cyprinus carpio TaxID=7962 RepID=A0A8C2FBL8_CYPCA
MALWKSAIVPIVLYICGCNSQSQDKVDQHTRIQFAFEGDTVTINCTYQTAYGSPTLFWYQQKVNGIPKHMLYKVSKSGNTEEEFKERFHANLSTTAVPLTIQDVHVSDSAVYYCTLQPTVTETHSTLIQKQYISVNYMTMQFICFHLFSIKPLLYINIL